PAILAKDSSHRALLCSFQRQTRPISSFELEMLSSNMRGFLRVVFLAPLLGAGAPRALWIDVPFVAQPENACGAACVSMVISYWASKSATAAPAPDAAQLYARLRSKDGKGIPAAHLQRYLEEQGFRAIAFAGDWGMLRDHLSKGRPLIAALVPK